MKISTAKKKNKSRFMILSAAFDIILFLILVAISFLRFGEDTLVISLVMLPAILTEFIMIILLKKDGLWAELLVTLCEVLMMFFIYFEFSPKFVILLVFPIVKAMYYNTKQNVLIASAVVVTGVIGLYFSSVFNGRLDESVADSLLNYLMFNVLPVVIIIVTACMVSLYKKGTVKKVEKKEKDIDQLVNSTLKDDKRKEASLILIKLLSIIGTTRSSDNIDHLDRVYDYMYAMCRKKGLEDMEAKIISMAIIPYDIGKIKISEAILNKPAKLTPQEFAEVKLHTSYGSQLLSGTGNEIIELSSVFAYQHHERWDGKGYMGMKGTEVNEYSYFVSVIDVFDALTSTRSYKDAWSIEDAYAEIVKGRGTQFSPQAVDVFSDCYEELKRIYKEKNPGAVKAARNRQQFINKVLKE